MGLYDHRRRNVVSAPRVVLAGGNGFLGQSLAGVLLEAGYDVDVLTRSPQPDSIGDQIQWDGATLDRWGTRIDGAAAVVNFTGKSVNCRYTPANRREIVESRVQSVHAINEAILASSTPPPVWVQSASLVFYGDAGSVICDETSPAGTGFSPGVCRQWEEAFDSTGELSCRKVLLRMGFALGRDGGALESLARLARFGLGGTVGNGRQYISWLHIADLNRMILESIENDQIGGRYNASTASPVTNAIFMRELRRAVHRPWSPPTPAPFVKVGAWMMGTEPELALTGRRCIPKHFLDQGFEFRFPSLREALSDVLA
jgi:uncharacterized protein (TIGR01777 family)